ncbi:SDR family oxidoreductase [Streptomyces sp. ODS28]|uniref:SDR family NAD(P)-dependent oxidoreductase n=1 Tax=Streptomyces sp. ODS28 TaxID=3136688 RepID=UPI0031E5AC4D
MAPDPQAGAEPGARRRRFEGQVALVTGSSRGYGRALSRALAAEGASLVLNSRRSPVDGKRLAAELRETGAEAVYVATDIGEEANVRELAALVERQFGRVDIVVHNAASGFERSIEATTWPEFEQAMRVNTYALISLARHFGPLFPGRGKFLYVSSLGAGMGIAGYGAIGAAKAASEAVVRSLALEWAPRFQANSVRPNLIPSVSLRSFSWADTLWKLLDEESPLGVREELGQLVDVALWLCSADSDYVTGQSINVDGGWSTTFCRDGLTTPDRPPAGVRRAAPEAVPEAASEIRAETRAESGPRAAAPREE